ncbi:hypothetical protein D9M71_456210 [compost metagenome]
MENFAGVIAIKHAETGEFLLGAVGFFVVVCSLSGGDVFGSGGDAKVVVEIAAFGRHPVELPAHAPFERLEFGERCVGNRYHGHVMVGQVLVGAVDVIAQVRATGAALIPALGEHEVVDDQLAAPPEQVRQFQFAVGSLEVVVLVDFHPGQGTAFGAESVPFPGEGFFVGQVLFAGGDPFFPRYDGMVLNVHVVFSCVGRGGDLHSLVVWLAWISTCRRSVVCKRPAERWPGVPVTTCKARSIARASIERTPEVESG